MRRLRLLAALVGCAASFLVPSGALAQPVAAQAAVPSPPGRLPPAIEPLAYYVAQSSCDPTVKRGTRELGNLLASTYRGTTWASAYQCGTDGTISEHYEGRAIDWMVSIHNARQRADARAVIHWLLATDSAGNRYAMARRLGVQYIIWNGRIWGSWNARWDEYYGCAKLTSRAYDNTCHRTHMHLSLSWNGATGRTSFWRGRTYAFDYGPCRAKDLNWASPRTQVRTDPCPEYPKVTAPAGASPVKKSLVTWSGAVLHRGMSGPAVSSVQTALHVPATGVFGAATASAVRTFRIRHGLAAHSFVGPRTWRKLLLARH